MRRAVVGMVLALSACGPLLPAPCGLTCTDVPQDLCNDAYEYVELTMGTRGGETLTSVAVGPTQVTECLHDDEPLADVIVRVEGRQDPVDLTFARTLGGEPSICFR